MNSTPNVNPRFKTISSVHPDFMSYLDGSFSAEMRALPVRSMNADARSEMAPGSNRDVVTFELISIRDIRNPSPFQLFWILLRPSTLILSLGPMMVIFAGILFKIGLSDQSGLSLVPWWMSIGALIGVLSLQVSVNLFNDYFDHIRGKDRLSARGGSRAIKNGWVAARTLKHAAWGLFGFSVLLGAPVVMTHFSAFILVAILALLAALEFASQKLGLKYRGFGEILAFAMTGPLLTVGFSWALIGTATWAQAAMGVVFGSISLMYYHAANFENIMPDDQAGISTWATRTGFDASKKFFHFTAVLTVCTAVVAMLWMRTDWRILVVPLLLAFYLTPLTNRVQRLASPLSSDLVGLRSKVIKLAWFTVVVIIAACFVFRS